MNAKPLSADLRVTFGENCWAARIKNGLSQQEVAAATGIPQARIAQIEHGRVNVTLETIARIARVLNREPASLIEPRGVD
jgi:DNA adenine methylase